MDASESTPRSPSASPVGLEFEKDALTGCHPECELDLFVRMPLRVTRKAVGKVVRRVIREPVIMLADDEPLAGSKE